MKFHNQSADEAAKIEARIALRKTPPVLDTIKVADIEIILELLESQTPYMWRAIREGESGAYRLQAVRKESIRKPFELQTP